MEVQLGHLIRNPCEQTALSAGVSSWGKGKELQISTSGNRDEVKSEKGKILYLIHGKYELRSVPVTQTMLSPVPGTLRAPWSSIERQRRGKQREKE